MSGNLAANGVMQLNHEVFQTSNFQQLALCIALLHIQRVQNSFGISVLLRFLFFFFVFSFLVPFALYLQQFGTRTCHFTWYLLHVGMVTLHFAWYLLHLAMFAFHVAWYLPHVGTSTSHLHGICYILVYFKRSCGFS